MGDKELTVKESRVKTTMKKCPEWAGGLKELFGDQMTPEQKPRCLIICIPSSKTQGAILAYKDTPGMPTTWSVNSPVRSKERKYLQESLQLAYDWEDWYGYWTSKDNALEWVDIFLHYKEPE